MSEYRFEELVDLVRGTLIGTREALTRYRREAEEQYFVVDEAGNRVPLTIQVHMPTRAGKAAPEDVIEVPMAELFSSLPLTLAELSFEFDCVIDERPWRRASDERAMTLNLKRWQAAKRPGIDKVRIECQARETFGGTVYVNGEVFKEFD